MGEVWARNTPEMETYQTFNVLNVLEHNKAPSLHLKEGVVSYMPLLYFLISISLFS